MSYVVARGVSVRSSHRSQCRYYLRLGERMVDLLERCKGREMTDAERAKFRSLQLSLGQKEIPVRGQEWFDREAAALR